MASLVFLIFFITIQTFIVDLYFFCFSKEFLGNRFSLNLLGTFLTV